MIGLVASICILAKDSDRLGELLVTTLEGLKCNTNTPSDILLIALSTAYLRLPNPDIVKACSLLEELLKREATKATLQEAVNISSVREVREVFELLRTQGRLKDVVPYMQTIISNAARKQPRAYGIELIARVCLVEAYGLLDAPHYPHLFCFTINNLRTERHGLDLCFKNQ